MTLYGEVGIPSITKRRPDTVKTYRSQHSRSHQKMGSRKPVREHQVVCRLPRALPAIQQIWTGSSFMNPFAKGCNPTSSSTDNLSFLPVSGRQWSVYHPPRKTNWYACAIE